MRGKVDIVWLGEIFVWFLTLVISSNPLVRKDMDLNEHERLSNIICRHKFKPKNRAFVTILNMLKT